MHLKSIRSRIKKMYFPIKQQNKKILKEINNHQAKSKLTEVGTILPESNGEKYGLSFSLRLFCFPRKYIDSSISFGSIVSYLFVPGIRLPRNAAGLFKSDGSLKPRPRASGVQAFNLILSADDDVKDTQPIDESKTSPQLFTKRFSATFFM